MINNFIFSIKLLLSTIHNEWKNLLNIYSRILETVLMINVIENNFLSQNQFCYINGSGNKSNGDRTGNANSGKKYSKYFRFDRWVKKKPIDYVIFDHIKLTFEIFHKIPKESFLKNSKFFKKLHYLCRFTFINKLDLLMHQHKVRMSKMFHKIICEEKYRRLNYSLYNVLFIKPRMFRRKYPRSSMIRDIIKWYRYRCEKMKYDSIYAINYIWAWFLNMDLFHKITFLLAMGVLFEALVWYPWEAYKETNGFNEFEEFLNWVREQQKPKRNKNIPLTIEERIAKREVDAFKAKRIKIQNYLLVEEELFNFYPTPEEVEKAKQKVYADILRYKKDFDLYKDEENLTFANKSEEFEAFISYARKKLLEEHKAEVKRKEEEEEKDRERRWKFNPKDRYN